MWCFFKFRIFVLVVAFGAGVFASPVLAAEPLKFSALEDSGPQEVAKLVLREAYVRLDLSVEFITLPGERALTESNAGRVDGELARVSGLEKKYPNLVRVPVAVSQLDGVVFSRKHDFPIEGWHSLKGYNIGAFTGSKFVENNTVGMDVVYVPGVKNLFSMLGRDRLDVIVIPYLSGLRYIKKHTLTGFRKLKPALTTLNLYHYLHIKNLPLLPRLTAVLKKMEKEKRIKAIRDEYVGRFQTAN